MPVAHHIDFCHTCRDNGKYQLPAEFQDEEAGGRPPPPRCNKPEPSAYGTFVFMITLPSVGFFGFVYVLPTHWFPAFEMLSLSLFTLLSSLLYTTESLAPPASLCSSPNLPINTF